MRFAWERKNKRPWNSVPHGPSFLLNAIVLSQQAFSGHLSRLGEGKQFEHRRRDIGKDAVAKGGVFSRIVHKDEGNRVRGMGGMGPAVFVDHGFCVAVVGR